MSIESIRQVLIENGFVKERIVISNIEQRELFSDSEIDELELEYNDINSGSQLRNDSDEKPLSAEGLKQNKNNNFKKDKSNYSPAQRIYLDQIERASSRKQIEKGEYNTYTGGLLFVPLMERYKI